MMNPAKTQADLWALVEERKKTATLAEHLAEADALVKHQAADLLAYRDRCATLSAIAERVRTAEGAMQGLATQLQTAQNRISALLQCLVWTRDRDSTWRGTAVDEVNRKLDEVIRGSGT